MLEATANSRYHSLVTGRAPEGVNLKVKKSFMTATSPVWNDDFGNDIGNPMLFPDSLQSYYRSEGGRFQWHMNPSTRPVVAGRSGRDATGPPQAQITLPNPAGQPAVNENYPAQPYEAIPFTVQGPPAVDNGRLTVHIQWTNPDTDWDLYIVDAAGEVVTSSASFGDTTEDAVLFDPPPGQYTAHVVNYGQVAGQPYDDWSNGYVAFRSPQPTVIGPQESWQLSCEDADGRLLATRNLVVDRGDRVNIGRFCGGAAAAKVSAKRSR